MRFACLCSGKEATPLYPSSHGDDIQPVRTPLGGLGWLGVGGLPLRIGRPTGVEGRERRWKRMRRRSSIKQRDRRVHHARLPCASRPHRPAIRTQRSHRVGGPVPWNEYIVGVPAISTSDEMPNLPRGQGEDRHLRRLERARQRVEYPRHAQVHRASDSQTPPGPFIRRVVVVTPRTRVDDGQLFVGPGEAEERGWDGCPGRQGGVRGVLVQVERGGQRRDGQRRVSFVYHGGSGSFQTGVSDRKTTLCHVNRAILGARAQFPPL